MEAPLTRDTPAAGSAFAGVPVPADSVSIERALEAFWRPQPGAEAPPRMRLTSVNLVWVSPRRDAMALAAVLPAVVRLAPARIIVVETLPELPAGQVTEAAVNAHCYLPAPRSPEVCAEIIRLSTGPATLGDIAVMAAPLVLSHVATVVFYKPSTPDWQRGATALAPVCDRLVLDCEATEALTSPVPAFPFDWFVVAPARDTLALCFDNPDLQPVLHAATAVSISCRESGPEARRCGALLAGWMAARVGWLPSAHQGKSVTFTFPAASPGQYPIAAVTVTDGSRTVAINFTAAGTRAAWHLDDGRECSHVGTVTLDYEGQAGAIARALAPGAVLESAREALRASTSILANIVETS